MARHIQKIPLWEAAGQTSPEEVLEADTAASLVALLRQIAGVVEHSANVFGSIQEESQKIGARCAALEARCSNNQKSMRGLEGRVKSPTCAMGFIRCSNGQTYQPPLKAPAEQPAGNLPPKAISSGQLPTRQGAGEWLPLRCRFSPVQSPTGSPLPGRPPSLFGRSPAAKSLTFPGSPSAPPPPLDLPFAASGGSALPALHESPPLAANQIPLESPLRTEGMAATPKATPKKGVFLPLPLATASPQQPGDQESLEVLSNPLYMLSLDVQSSLPQRVTCPPDELAEDVEDEDSESAGAVSISARSESASPTKQEAELAVEIIQAAAATDQEMTCGLESSTVLEESAHAATQLDSDTQNINPEKSIPLLGLGTQQIMLDTQQAALDAPETDRSAVSVEVRGQPLPTSPFSRALQKGGFDCYQDIVHEFGNSSRDLGPLGAARSGSLGLRGLSGMQLAPGHAFTLNGHLSRGLQDLHSPLPSNAISALHTLEAMQAAKGGLMSHPNDEGREPRPPLGGLAAADVELLSHQGGKKRLPRPPQEILGGASEEQLVSDAVAAAVSRPPLTTLAVKATLGSDAMPARNVAGNNEVAGDAAASEGTAEYTPFISARSNRLDGDEALLQTPRPHLVPPARDRDSDSEDYGPAYMRTTHPRTLAIPPEIIMATGPLRSSAAAWSPELLSPLPEPSPERQLQQQAGWQRSHYSQYVLHGFPGRQSPRAAWNHRNTTPSPVHSTKAPIASQTASPAASWHAEDSWEPVKAAANVPMLGQENVSVNRGWDSGGGSMSYGGGGRSVRSLTPAVSPLTSPLQEPSPSGRFPRRFGVGPYMAHRVVITRGGQ